MKFGRKNRKMMKEGVGAGYTITLEDDTRFYSTGYSIDDDKIEVNIDISEFKDDFEKLNAEHPYWDTQYGRQEYGIETPLKTAKLVLFKDKFFKNINDECTEYYNNYLKKMEKYHQTEKASAEEYLSMSDTDKLNYICETLFKSGCFFEFGKDSKVYRGSGYTHSKLDNPLNIGVSVANFNIFKPNYIFIDFEMYEGKEQSIEGVISFDFEYDSFAQIIEDGFDDYDSYRNKIIEVSDIDWETDDEDADLPDSVEIDLYEIADDDKDSDKLESAIIDYLSDEYGFLVKDFNYNVITESKKQDKKVVKENKMTKLRKRTIKEATELCPANIEEFFGTLMQSIVESWGLHLKTESYAVHKALNEFYDEMLELVDTLIENYQGIYGKTKSFKTDVFEVESDNAVDYLSELKDFVKCGRTLISEDDTEILSDIDSILSCIDETLYKLKNLK